MEVINIDDGESMSGIEDMDPVSSPGFEELDPVLQSRKPAVLSLLDDDDSEDLEEDVEDECRMSDATLDVDTPPAAVRTIHGSITSRRTVLTRANRSKENDISSRFIAYKNDAYSSMFWPALVWL
jgi:hypothetical protein